MSDYYQLLGVPRTASQKDIRSAYRSLARQFHPDVNAGEKASEEKFKEINEAYSVLSDQDKRRKYDRYGDNWAHSDQMDEAAARAGHGGGFQWTGAGGDDPFSAFGVEGGGIFDGLFGNVRQRVRRPRSTEYQVEVSLEEAYNGTTRVLTQSGGRRLEVKIPAGVDNGSRVHIAPDSGGAGDLYLVISVQEHKQFQRQGRDLYTEVEARLEEAVLGGDLHVTTLRGRLALTIPPETQNGQRFRLAGQGMPALNNPDTKGDLYATVKVKLPTGLSEEEQELFRRLRELQASKSE